MPKQLTTTHTLIERQLVIYKRERSAIWQCRYQVDSKWQRTSTNERDLDKAKAKAHELLIEANVRKKLNVAPITRYFKDIAKLAIQRMEKELRDGNGKIMYKEYIAIIQNYLSKYFGKHYIDSIDYQLIKNFDKWREEKLGRVPARSTLLNHNAALNRVFDEAVIRGFIVNSNRPKLVAKGKEGERRDDFSLEEVRAIRSNFDAWIARGKADSIAIRELLKDYVLMLLDTGARAGAELLDLKWVQIERKHDPVITKTAEVDEQGEHGGEAIELVNLNRGAIIYIEKHKTKPRYIYGRAPTVQANKFSSSVASNIADMLQYLKDE